MSDPAAERNRSLIQRRMALKRQRNLAIIFLIVFGFSAAWWVVRGFLDNAGVIVWFLGGAFLLIFAMSAYLLATALGKLRAFEAEPGPSAGEQS